jgi:hypothetical protein
MRNRQSCLRNSATPIGGLIGDMLADIERCLNSDNGEMGSSESCGWFDACEDTVVSSTSFDRVLSLTSQTAYSASRRAMQLSIAGSENTDYNVLYVSRTLSVYDLACSLIATASFISAGKLVSGRLTDAEWDRLEATLARIHDQEFSVIHRDTVDDLSLCDWLSHASGSTTTTPLLVLDDAALLCGFQCHPRGGRADALLKLAKAAASADALVVLVEETRLH